MMEYRALAIEAAADQLSVAACCGGRVVTREVRPAREGAPFVFEYARQLVEQVAGDFSQLDFVAFGCGPGSFTGVRIAAAAAQAIAFAAAIPVCRVSSLAVLAAGIARAQGPGHVGTCIDARTQHAYFALYRADSCGAVRAVFPDALVDPMDFTVPGNERFVALGSGWQSYPTLVERHGERIIALDVESLPSARDLLPLAMADFAAGRTVVPAEALPEYLSPGPGQGAQRPRHSDRR